MKKKRKSYELHEAVIHNDKDLVIKLINNGLDVNELDDNGYSPLHYATQDYLIDITRILLNNSASVDIKDGNGNTPLSNAVFYFTKDPTLIDLLLTKGANKYAENNYGVSPYSLAKSIANYPVFQYLK